MLKFIGINNHHKIDGSQLLILELNLFRFTEDKSLIEIIRCVSGEFRCRRLISENDVTGGELLRL